jgi:putative endonuclease
VGELCQRHTTGNRYRQGNTLKQAPAGTAYQRGMRAEQAARDFLVKRGLTELARNYRTRFGEIDLVMRHGGIVVFTEVRARTGTGYMKPVESIDAKKVRKIILAGRGYLQDHPGDTALYRFDIVVVTGNIQDPAIEWIQNAFADEQPA